ncbi:hypothetical protein CGCFRS4_v016133 [Colletotrichum fructicola]|nr:hypothetical protein CGCFRS4_v016133 [Colletotrichum fructicola]
MMRSTGQGSENRSPNSVVGHGGDLLTTDDVKGVDHHRNTAVSVVRLLCALVKGNISITAEMWRQVPQPPPDGAFIRKGWFRVEDSDHVLGYDGKYPVGVVIKVLRWFLSVKQQWMKDSHRERAQGGCRFNDLVNHPLFDMLVKCKAFQVEPAMRCLRWRS